MGRGGERRKEKSKALSRGGEAMKPSAWLGERGEASWRMHA